MRPRVRAFTAAYLPLIAGLAAALLLLTWVDPVARRPRPVPSGAQKALAPVTKMIATLVAIAIGLGIAICGAVIVWGGIEKTLAGANTDAEHRAQKRITQRDHGPRLDGPRGRHRQHDHRDRRRLRPHREAVLTWWPRWRRSRDSGRSSPRGSSAPPRRRRSRRPRSSSWPWRSVASVSTFWAVRPACRRRPRRPYPRPRPPIFPAATCRSSATRSAT